MANAAAFLRQQLGDGATSVFQQLSPTAQEIINAPKPAAWAPVSALSELTRATAALAEGDQDRARDLLIASGVFMAREAVNTFLRLLLKLLNPTLFASKMPGVWARDFSRGRLAAEAKGDRIICHTYEMDGFEHGVCTSAGFAKYVLESMGYTVKSAEVQGWSLESPSADGAAFEIIWEPKA